MCCSSPSPPPAPDYVGIANEQNQGQIEASRIATQANRPAQYTPFGSSTWERPNYERTFNEDAWNSAMGQYNTSLADYNEWAPYTSGYVDGPEGQMLDNRANPRARPENPLAPNREDEQFWNTSGADDWVQRITLDPKLQAAAESQMEISRRLSDTASGMTDRVNQQYQNPLSFDDLGPAPSGDFAATEAIREAMLSRIMPELQKQRAGEISRLKASGIDEGSAQAWNNSMTRLDQKDVDAQMQALLGAADNADRIFGRQMQGRQQNIKERTYLHDKPLNDLNALLSGQQVQGPSFPNFSQQGQTAGPDLLGAAKGNYDAALGSYNAGQAGDDAQMAGLATLVGSAFGSPWLGAAMGLTGAAAGR